MTVHHERAREPAGVPVLALDGVALGYADRPVVHDVDLTLRAGEVVAVLGPNGCGKSTLVKGILGLTRVFAGDIRLFGVPAAKFTQRARLGYVPQRISVGAGLPVTVWETVAAGRLPRMRRFRPMRAADRRAVRCAIDLVGLAGRERARVSELSGGQQRRVLIARALAGDADVLVLDEPMAGIDLPSQEQLAATLGDLVATGRTVLVVLHELGALAPLITRIVGLREGRVVYDGPPRPDDYLAPGASEPVHHDDPQPGAGAARLQVSGGIGSG